MATEIIAPSSAPAVAPDGRVRTSSALAARRWFLIASPVLAGLLTIGAAYADPAVGLEGPKLWELYADNPGRLQFKSLGFHWAYAFWIVPAMLVAAYVRGRGAWLANITALVGFAGMTTLPGLLITDWMESAIGQVYGVEGNQAVVDTMNTMWGVPVFITPGIIGLVLALPLTAITLWRAGLARWWSLAAALGALAAFTLSNITWWGCALATVCLAVFSVALAKATAPR